MLCTLYLLGDTHEAFPHGVTYVREQHFVFLARADDKYVKVSCDIVVDGTSLYNTAAGVSLCT